MQINQDPAKPRVNLLRALLIPVILFAGFWFLINWIMNANGSTYAQPDALFYTSNGKQVMATVITNFKVYAVKQSGTYGTDHIYAAAIDLPTGKELWKVKLNAKDNNGRDDGGAKLLGQSDKYLFFLRNELYVIDKQTGEIVARDNYFTAIKDKMPKEILMDYTGHANYAFNDSTQTVVIKGTDGLFYTIDANTLKTGTIDIPNPDAVFGNNGQLDYDRDKDSHHIKPIHSYGITLDYDDYISDVYDDGQHCFTLLDNKDTLQLDQKFDVFTFQDRQASIRRVLYKCNSDGQGEFIKLNPGVFLFGGFLSGLSKPYHQPADTIATKKPYRGLAARYNQPFEPLRLPDGGFIIMHKATIQRDALIILTAVSAGGKTLWTVNTPFANVGLIHADNNTLYLMGNKAGEFQDNLKQVFNINLLNGATSQYKID